MADVAVTEALQSLYAKVRSQLLEGSFEIDRKAIDVNVRINTPFKMFQKGNITQLAASVKRLRIGANTIVFAYGGSPCQKVCKGILFQRDENIMVGPHQEPSNLFWLWQGALATLASSNGNRYQDIASLSEMVDPALDIWLRDFEKVGFVKKACMPRVWRRRQ